MKNILTTFKQNHWNSRAPRERRAILIAIVFLTPVLLYVALWQPATTATQKLLKTLPTLRSQSAQLQADVKEVEKLKHMPQHATLDSSALKSTLENTAERYKIRETMSNIEIQPPNAVRISFNAVAFEHWTAWARELQQVQHIRVESASITALPETGKARITASFSSGSAQ